MKRRPTPEAAVSFLVVTACALFVFSALHPSKLLLSTTPAGGDMGAHVWAPDYLRHHLFPHGRITGWSPDWYDGFPALTFYFPLPYLLIALLSYVLPYGIAFKLVSVSGVVGLPVAAWAFGRLLRMRFPGPPLLAVATLPFLFDRYFTIWGGNLASTLAGEFAFTISLCLALVFLGVFYRCLDSGRYRGLAALLLAATALCHVLPTMFAVVGAVLLFLMRPNPRRFGRGLTVGIVAGAIAAFWLVPFVFRFPYSNDMGWERTTEYLKNLFPFMNHASDAHPDYTRHLKVVVALAAAGALGGIFLRRRATLLITGLGLVAAAAFRLMPQGVLWNARMLPFWYLCLYLAAAAGVAEAANAVGILFGRRAYVPEPLPSPTWVLSGQTGVGAAGEPAGEPAAELPSYALVGADGAQGPAGPTGVDPLAPPPPALPDWTWPPPTPPTPPTPPDWSSAPDWPPAPAAGGDDGGGGARADGDDGDLVPSRVPGVAAPLLVLLVVSLMIGQTIVTWLPSWLPRLSAPGDHNFVVDWANWNYSGYERKSSYPEYQDVVSTMQRVGATHGCGRAMWEYEAEEDRFGTPMALMLLPKWTNGCIGSMEGLFFESSATVPYHFLNQSELSKSPSDAMRNLHYRGLDVSDGIAHLRLLGVKYYMAISPETQAQASATPGVHLIDTTSRPYTVTYTVSGVAKAQPRTWEVFQIDGSDPVAPLSYQPAVLNHPPASAKGWIKVSEPWYQDPTRWAVPLAASGPRAWVRVDATTPNPPRIPVRPAVVSNIRMSDDRIAFDVDQPGSPVLVKTSYFPNWQASGARGPWRVTPNLMVVIPTARHVELHYGFTPVDNAGRLLTLGGLVAAGVLWRREGARRSGTGDGERGDLDADLDREFASLLTEDGTRDLVEDQSPPASPDPSP